MTMKAQAEPRLIVACMARNEEHRFWRSVLGVWNDFADSVVVLDDQSTDHTARIAIDAGATVFPRGNRATAWGYEHRAREALWNLTLSVSSPGDYVFVLDADMIPARNPRELLSLNRDSWAFLLFDLWGPSIYREDGYWQAHLTPRVWMVRVPEKPWPTWEWSGRGIHCGHLPSNLATNTLAQAPLDMSIVHYGYYTADIRREKLERYGSVVEQLTPFERAHAQTIMDPEPKTRRLPFKPQYRLELA